MGSKVEVFQRTASQKKHPETVVFIHNMLGNHRSVLRHSRLLNSWGYDTVSFDLIWGSSKWQSLLSPLALDLPKGAFKVWEKQITQVLDQVSGKKIVYGFSGPSLAAFLAVSQRTDIVKIICDGGPFNDFIGNTKNLFQQPIGIPWEKPLFALTLLGAYLWGPSSERALQKSLGSWRKEVPILSIRGLKDPIVIESTIVDVFCNHPHLPITFLEIPQGQHLDGLKNFEALYKKTLSQFLNQGSSGTRNNGTYTDLV